MATFDYTAYYRRLQEIKKLQIPADAVCWTERYTPPERAYEIVLYLGCNILRTPDIAADVVAVFTALGLDFIAVAGVQFCCGITWDRFGDIAKGQSVSTNTIERLASYNPQIVVHWCPSCDVHFSDVVTGRDEQALPFTVTNATAFLSDRSRKGLMPWRNPVSAGLKLIGKMLVISCNSFPARNLLVRSMLRLSTITTAAQAQCDPSANGGWRPEPNC
jgi:Fe-S oxidoreductase